MDLKEIINAWAISFNPNPEQKQKALERTAICGSCEKLKTETFLSKKIKICSACGCPISKKVFSGQYNPCPLKKWEEVDKKYVPIQKNEKTLF